MAINICTEYKVPFGIWGQSDQFVNVWVSFLESERGPGLGSNLFLKCANGLGLAEGEQRREVGQSLSSTGQEPSRSPCTGRKLLTALTIISK